MVTHIATDTRKVYIENNKTSLKEGKGQKTHKRIFSQLKTFLYKRHN